MPFARSVSDLRRAGSIGVHEPNQMMADAGIFVFFRCSAVVLCSVCWELVESSQAQ